jgi:hypothetical protein
MSTAEPFDVFLARTAAARLEEYAEVFHRRGVPPGEAAAEFERMKAYILRYYEGVLPLHSFLDANNTPVDCIPWEQQPTVRAARAAGLELPDPPAASRTDAPNSGVGHSRPLCPGDAVPLARLTLDRMVQSGGFTDYFRKQPYPSPQGSGPPDAL